MTHPIDILEKIAFDDAIEQPQGDVTVQLRDERGKIKHEEKKPNFISKVWKAHARGVLRVMWQGFGYNWQGGAGPATYGSGDRTPWPYGINTIPMLPIQNIGCWNDTTAEDAVNEDMIYMPPNATGMVAWASRHPFANPTGARGAVNTTESMITETNCRFVFDWISSQGNGTFQSVGWFKAGVPGIPVLPYGDHHRGTAVTATLTPGSHITSATGLYQGGGWYDSASGKFYFTIRRTPTSGAMRIVSVPMSSYLDDSTAGIMGVSAAITGLTLTNESDEFTPTSSVTTATGHGQVLGIDSGGNRIFSYYVGSSQYRWGKIAAAGANTNYAQLGGSTPFTDLVGCVLGTTVYMASQTDSNIYAGSTTTGALSATIAIDANVSALCTLGGLTTPRVTEMCTDGTDLYVMYGQANLEGACPHLLVRLNTSGVLQQIYGMVPFYQSSGFIIEVAGAPYAGNIYFPSGNNWESALNAYPLSPDGSSSSQTAEMQLSTTGINDSLSWGTSTRQSAPGYGAGYRQLIYADGGLYVLGHMGTSNWGTTSFNWMCARLGFNLGSRVKLASPVVKASTDTMKITYDVTLPGWF